MSAKRHHRVPVRRQLLGLSESLSTTTVSAITAMSQVNVLSIARTFLSPHTHAYLSHGLGFMHVDETEKRTDVDKIRLKKCQVIFQRQVTEFAMGVFWDQSSEKEARSSHEWLHKGSLFTGHAKSY